MSRPTEPIAVRLATGADHAAIERLAALDSAPVPSGQVLTAELAGEPQAAIELETGATIADPFRPTAHVVELLAARAARQHDALASGRRPRRRRSLAPRVA